MKSQEKRIKVVMAIKDFILDDINETTVKRRHMPHKRGCLGTICGYYPCEDKECLLGTHEEIVRAIKYKKEHGAGHGRCP